MNLNMPNNKSLLGLKHAMPSRFKFLLWKKPVIVPQKKYILINGGELPSRTVSIRVQVGDAPCHTYSPFMLYANASKTF